MMAEVEFKFRLARINVCLCHLLMAMILIHLRDGIWNQGACMEDIHKNTHHHLSSTTEMTTRKPQLVPIQVCLFLPWCGEVNHKNADHMNELRQW